MADPTLYVEPPARTPRRGGISEFAEFREDSRIALGALPEFTSAGCAFPVDDVRLCYPSGGADQNTKTPDGIDTIEAAVGPFGLYSGVECWLDGGDDFLDRARAALEQGQDRGIEKRLDTWLKTLAATTATNFLDAVAKAEEYADDNYLGAPLLILNRGDAVRAKQQGALDHIGPDGLIVTANGTRVLASGAVTPGTVGVVGALTVLHTEIISGYAPTVTSNTQLALAERAYSILVDCDFAARFTVS